MSASQVSAERMTLPSTCRRHFEREFGTPTGVSIADLWRAHGVTHELVSTAAELSAVVSKPPEGLQVVEVRVDGSGHRGLPRR